MRVERCLPGSTSFGIGDLGGIEARAQQELREVRDQIADRPDLALEAVTLAEQHGEAMPRPSPKIGKRMAIGAGIRRGSGKSSGIGGRLEHDGGLGSARQQARRWRDQAAP